MAIQLGQCDIVAGNITIFTGYLPLFGQGSVVPDPCSISSTSLNNFFDDSNSVVCTLGLSKNIPEAQIPPEDIFDYVEVFDNLGAPLITLSRTDPNFIAYRNIDVSFVQWDWSGLCGFVNGETYTAKFFKEAASGVGVEEALAIEQSINKPVTV